MLPAPSAFIENVLSYTENGLLDLRSIKVSEDSDEPIEISTQQIIELASALKEKPSITSFAMCTPNLTVEAAKALTTTHIVWLMLEGCDLTDEVAAVLFSSDSFEALWLAFTGINGACLANIENLVNLRVLDLSYNPIEEKYCEHIAKNHSLRGIDLCGAGIENEGLKKLSESDSLREIAIANCGITEVCPLGPPLVRINLSDNRISNIEGLLQCEPLPEVILSGNRFSEEDDERLMKHYPNSRGYSYRCNATASKRKLEEEKEEDRLKESKSKKNRLR